MAGNFRARRRSKALVKPSVWGILARRAVRRIGRGIAAALEGGLVLFFVVVIGVALLFRVGIGWARASSPEADASSAETKDEPKPARRERARATAGGVATIAAVTGARARALTLTRDMAKPVLAFRPEPTLEPAKERPTPSFLRAREQFEHRHADTSLEARPQNLARPRGTAKGKRR